VASILRRIFENPSHRFEWHFVHVGDRFRAFSGVEVADDAVRRQAGIPECRHATDAASDALHQGAFRPIHAYRVIEYWWSLGGSWHRFLLGIRCRSITGQQLGRLLLRVSLASASRLVDAAEARADSCYRRIGAMVFNVTVADGTVSPQTLRLRNRVAKP
jgi:hypothetical protein